MSEHDVKTNTIKKKRNFGFLKLMITFALLGGAAYAGGTWFDNKMKADNASAQAKAEEGTETSVFRLDVIDESYNDDFLAESYYTITFKHKNDEIRMIEFKTYTKFRDNKYLEKNLKDLKVKKKNGKYYHYLGPDTYHVYDLENSTKTYHSKANYKDMKEGGQQVVGIFPRDIEDIGPDEDMQFYIKADKTPFSVYQKLLIDNDVRQIQ